MYFQLVIMLKNNFYLMEQYYHQKIPLELKINLIIYLKENRANKQ